MLSTVQALPHSCLASRCLGSVGLSHLPAVTWLAVARLDLSPCCLRSRAVFLSEAGPWDADGETAVCVQEDYGPRCGTSWGVQWGEPDRAKGWAMTQLHRGLPSAIRSCVAGPFRAVAGEASPVQRPPSALCPGEVSLWVEHVFSAEGRCWVGWDGEPSAG